MNTIGVRELQQHASAALERVERGETIGVTNRGRLVAVINPPSAASGAAALLAAGRVRPAHRTGGKLPPPVRSSVRTSEALDHVRADR